MAAFSNICRKSLLKSLVERNTTLVSFRCINTTKVLKDSSKDQCPPPEAIYKKPPDFSKPLENPNWVSYGFHSSDKEQDRHYAHVFMFASFTVLFCGLGFAIAYSPDKKREHWARREAFIRLHEREQLGLDPIDPNYVDPENMVLPPDEELSDSDIII